MITQPTHDPDNINYDGLHASDSLTHHYKPVVPEKMPLVARRTTVDLTK